MGLSDKIMVRHQMSLEEAQEKAVSAFFEPHLRELELGVDQIETQTLNELHQSLERVNDAIKNPDSFGVLGLQILAETGTIAVSTNSDKANIRVGVLPTLLKRKRIIVERIAQLSGSQKIENIRDLVSGIGDENTREDLLKQIDELESNSRKYEEEAGKVQAQEVQIREKLQLEHEACMIWLEAFERRSKVLQSFLERESVASIIGALLLLALAATHIGAMFYSVTPSEVVTNSFLIILGYFFGQTVGRRTTAGAWHAIEILRNDLKHRRRILPLVPIPSRDAIRLLNANFTAVGVL